MFHLSVPLNVVLPPYEIPEEVTPVHEVYLISQEEAQVLCHRRHTILLLYATHPILVGLSMAQRMHTGEQHIVLIHIVIIVSHHLVFLLRRVGHRAIDGLALLLFRHQVITFWLTVYFAAIRWTIEERRLAVLLAVQIAAKGKDVVRGVLTHRRTGIGSDKDDAIAAITCQYHQHTG